MKKNREFRFDANVPEDICSNSSISLEGDPKQDRLDTFIVKHFSKFIILCLVMDLLLIYSLHASTVADIIYTICMGFVVGFFVLGVISYILSDKGTINWKLDLLIFLLIPLSMSGILWMFGSEFDPSRFLIKLLSTFGITDVTFTYLVLAIFVLFVVIFFVSFAVISVIVGFFRKYTFRILRFIAKSKDSDSKKKRFAYRFFNIPDIIDVKDVELDPVDDIEGFDYGTFLNVFFSLFLLGLVICSYIFLNPVFLTELPFDEMVLISFMLSLFMSPLVLPWNIMRSVGAKVISQARPYYLWKGMKSRMYQGFFAISFVMMILMLSAYLGMDFSRIATTYLGYILFMCTISIFTSYIYVNYFLKGFKNGIIVSFYEHKYRN